MKKYRIFFIQRIIWVFFILLLSNPLLSNDKFIISSFSTSLAHQEDGVKLNISLACDKIDGTVLLPGDTFSFNETVGEGSTKNGYVEGRVLYRDQVKYEPGGGLCQVSSTLFNALLMAGLRIVERHRHYQPVTYVPIGLDATIKYGKKDLRMKNTLSQKIYIQIVRNDKNLVVVVKGEKELLYKYQIDREEDELTLPLSNDKRNIRNGLSVYVYRKKFKKNKLIENVLLYKDFYPPVKIK